MLVAMIYAHSEALGQRSAMQSAATCEWIRRLFDKLSCVKFIHAMTHLVHGRRVALAHFSMVACCQPIRGHSLLGSPCCRSSRGRSSSRAAQLFNGVQRGGDVLSAREPCGIDFGIACMLFRHFSNSKCDNESVFRATDGAIEQSSARRL